LDREHLCRLEPCRDIPAESGGQDSLILIRPDGYIGLIADADNALAVADYLRSL
jgi:hypothetical protein